MASISALNSPNIPSFHWKRVTENLISRPIFVSFPPCKVRPRSIKATSDGPGPVSNGGADLLRKPMASAHVDDDEGETKGADGDTWVDWEDQILQDTVPLVGFVRMILHSGKYESGDRLSPEHEKIILDRFLAHHPESDKKIGCGVDYITIGYHPNFERSRCLFIVRKDGELVDFSFWKCIKGLIRKNYPLYADNFILRHFSKRNRRSSD